MSTGVSAADRPNVVFLLSDDQGWNDYGFMGHPHLQTPNIDRLAQAGLIYQRGHVTAPMCRPSLASLVTGMYPHQTEIRGNDPVLPPNEQQTCSKGQAGVFEVPQSHDGSDAAACVICHRTEETRLRDSADGKMSTTNGWHPCFFWLAISFGLVGLADLALDHRFFGKFPDGSMAFASVAILLSYLL